MITELLSDVLAGHGCASVLDASLAGGPVYERMGFADHGLTTVMGYAGGSDAIAADRRRMRATDTRRCR